MKRFTKFGELEIIETFVEREKRKRTCKIDTNSGISRGTSNQVILSEKYIVKYQNIEVSAKDNKNRAKKVRLIEQNRVLQNKVVDMVQRSINNDTKNKKKLQRLRYAKV